MELSLGEIAEQAKIVLLDTSALSISRDRHTPRFFKREIGLLQKESDFFQLLRDSLNKGENFYITPLVNKEIGDSFYPYKKIVKNRNPRRSRETLDLRRKKLEITKGRRSLLNLFEERDRILKLQPDEQIKYMVLYEKYFPLQEEYGLSRVDFDLLFSALSLIENKKFVSLLSNDIYINKARKKILSGEKIDFQRLNFFVRNGSNKFVQLSSY